MRHFPDGRKPEWEQVGVKGLLADPQLPFFIHWLSEHELQPKALKGTIELVEIEIAGTRGRVEDWLGIEVGDAFDGVSISFTSPNGQPGLAAATFDTPNGLVRI